MKTVSKLELKEMDEIVLRLERATQAHDDRRKPGTLMCGLCISRDALRLIVKRIRTRII